MDNSSSEISQVPGAESPTLGLPPVDPGRNVVFFNERGLRAGWRLLIYVVLVITMGALITLIGRKISPPQVGGLPTPQVLLASETISFSLVFVGALILARIERRSPGVYGLPVSEAFGRKFWLGMLFGLVEVCALMGLISLFGGYSFGSLALSSIGVLRWGMFHLVIFTMVGLFEEFAFRGYTQFTLADGIGFWPAALLLSFGFGAAHLGNQGEGWVGAASVVLVGTFFAFTLYRTGNLWYAVGLHASFDWGETFLFSVPNSGLVMQGHLSNAVLHGPKWLTGASVGPEGSVFCFLTVGLQFLVVMWLFPKRQPGM